MEKNNQGEGVDAGNQSAQSGARRSRGSAYR
jgi:hypothetical protein